MISDSVLFTLIIVGFLAYLGVVIGALQLKYWRRTTRWPFKDADKLLRMPGEALRRKVDESMESFMGELLGAGMALLLLPYFTMLIAQWAHLTRVQILIVCSIAVLVVIAYSTKRILRLWQLRANCFLGWYGERFTADKLRPLQAEGFHVFHDIPATGENGKPFNLDHVVVGSTGVFLIETKARRKGKARPGYEDHKVKFDGQQLIWPWGEDRHGIDQAINEGAYLGKLIATRTGLRVPVKCILTFPSWYVIEETINPQLRVMHTGWIAKHIRSQGERLLDDKQVDAIVDELNRICRNVEE
jgi:hypothetical protein